jgi:diaminohydroxyphosphoribosylaminopyrimidine deaminase/5-amino-6-(5-phosphoribosylamino)uracil reductase
MKDHIFPSDEAAMSKALEIAASGIGLVEPNPAVGAIITAENRRFISAGFHPKFGGPHAEVVALRKAGHLARGATVYVTLEPCSHHGKTPPCADA